MRNFFLCVLNVLYHPMRILSGIVFLFGLWRTHLKISIPLGLLKPGRGGVFYLGLRILTCPTVARADLAKILRPSCDSFTVSSAGVLGEGATWVIAES